MTVMDPLKKKKEEAQVAEMEASESASAAHYGNEKYEEAIDLANNQYGADAEVDYRDQEQNEDLLAKAISTASPIQDTFPEPVEDEEEEEADAEEEDDVPAIEPSSALDGIEETEELAEVLSFAQT